MSNSFRYPEIIEMARRSGRVTVDGLAEHFGVTHQTIRRDLADLSGTGQLDRVHGGAVLASGTTNIQYQDRRVLNEAAKSAIAALCAASIPNDSSVFLGIGTSTEAVAKALLGHRNLLVMTNNVNVATILSASPHCDVLVTGGNLRRSDGGLVGTLAASMIRQFKFDLAVIGCSAIDADGDLLDYDVQEVDVSQTVARQARAVHLVADNSKFHRTAPARVFSMQRLDAVYTDQAMPGDLTARCAEWNVAVLTPGAGRAAG